MDRKASSKRQAALVIDASGAQPTGDLMTVMQLARRFADERISATWVVDSPAIADAIQPASSDTALFDWAVRWQDADAASTGASIRTEAPLINSLRTAGLACSTVYACDAARLRGEERRLVSLGVSAVVDGDNAAESRPLPHGIWQFGVDLTLPRRRNWKSRLFSPASQFFRAAALLGVAVIQIQDVRRHGARGTREVGRMIDRVVAQVGRGEMEVRTIGQLAAQRTDKYANRPQRSILRAA